MGTEMQGFVAVVEWLARVGPTGLLAAGLWALITGRLITLGQYNALKEERDSIKAQRDKLLDLALENAQLARIAATSKPKAQARPRSTGPTEGTRR